MYLKNIEKSRIFFTPDLYPVSNRYFPRVSSRIKNPGGNRAGSCRGSAAHADRCPGCPAGRE